MPESDASPRRLLAATLLAPLVPGLMLATVFCLAEGLPDGGLALLVLVALYLAFSLPVAVPAAILLLAAYLVLRRRRWQRWWSVTAAGGLIGWLCVFALAWLFEDPAAADVLHLASTDALLTAACGMAAGLAFWHLARRPRRDVVSGLAVVAAGLMLLAAAGELLAAG